MASRREVKAGRARAFSLAAEEYPRFLFIVASRVDISPYQLQATGILSMLTERSSSRRPRDVYYTILLLYSFHDETPLYPATTTLCLQPPAKSTATLSKPPLSKIVVAFLSLAHWKRLVNMMLCNAVGLPTFNVELNVR